MVSTMHLDSFGGGVVNWNWAKASKIKSGLRAPRRPKVYSAENKRKAAGRSLKESENVASKRSNLGDMSVIESEKLGVSILGRRFSDSIQNVPIKKRRFLQLKSPSPPGSPSHLPQASGCSLAHEDSGVTHHSETTHHFNVEHQGNNSERKRDSGPEKNVTNEYNKWETNDTFYEGVDFSGISILAAAACNSSAGDIISSEASVTREQDEEVSHLISGKAESHVPQVNKHVDQHLKDSNIFDSKTIISDAMMDTSVQCKEDEDINMMGESEILEEQLSNSHNMLESTNETVNKASARDGRFHWDLNKAIDTWEDSDAGFFDSVDPLLDSNSKDAVKSDGVHAVQMGHESAKSPSKLDSDVCWNEKLIDVGPSKDFDGLAERDLLFNHGSVAGHNGENHSPTVHIHDSAQNKHFSSEDVNCVVNERLASNNSRNECVDCEAGKLSGGQNVDHSYQTVALEDFLKSNHVTVSKTLHSQQDFIESACTTDANSNQSVECHLENDPAKESIVQDSERALATDVFDEQSDDVPVNGYANCTLKHHNQPDDTLVTDSKNAPGTFPGDPHMSAALISQSVNKINEPAACTWNLHKHADDTLAFDSKSEASTCPGDPNVSAPLANDSVINNKSVDQYTVADSCTVVEQSELVGNTSSGHGQSEQIDRIMPQDLSLLVELKSTGSCAINAADEYEKQKMQVQKCVSPGSRDFSNSPSSRVVSVEPCANLKDASAVVKISGETCSGDHFHCDSDSTPSDYNLEQQTETENGELHGDDSQYEDGEFRESTILDWQLDGDEEGEAEHVDYGSDSNRDAELDAASPSSHSFAGQLTSRDTGYNSEKASEDNDLPVAGEIPRDCMKVFSEHYQCSNISREKKKHLAEKVTRDHIRRRDASEQSSRSASDNKQVSLNSKIVVDCNLYSENSDVNEEPRHATTFKMKSSGRDCFQEHPKATSDVVVDARTGCNKTNPSGATYRYAESRRNAGSMLSLDLPSRISRSKSSEILRRKDQAFTLGKRVNLDEPSVSVERDSGHASFTRRDGVALHRNKRGGRAGGTCDRSSGQWGLGRHKSPRKYESSRFNQSNFKNVSHASTMKVKSNGFNVAPEGTVIEPRSGSVECVRQASRQNVNPSLQAPRSSLPKDVSRNQRNEPSDLDRSLDFGHSREVSPDRHGSVSRGRSRRYDPRVVSAGHRGRYTRPAAVGDDIDSSLPACHTFSRREHNYSSQRNSIQMWSRSPHGCTSTRRKDDDMNDLRRWSKSSNIRFAARGERMRSPHQQPGYLERMPDIVPSCKGNVSLPHASRWIGQRKGMEDDFGDDEYRRLPGRNPPTRIFSQSHRLDMESGRIKAEEYNHSSDHGRFHDFSVSSRPRFGVHGDRGHGSRCEMFDPPSAQYGVDDDMKHLTCDIGDGRNPPSRKYSRSHRLNVDDEAEEYHRTSDPGRFHDFSFSRRPRFDSRGDRGHESRYEMFNSPSAQYDIVDDVKHLTYDIDDGFRLNNTQFKGGSHFDGRGSPREFDRGIEGYIDSPPQRRGHERHFRYDREVRQNSSFRSFRFRECDENVTQRRRLS